MEKRRSPLVSIPPFGRGFSRHGVFRSDVESFLLAPWATRRRQDQLELLDRLKPIIADLNTAVQEEAERRPEVRRLMTHPGVGPITALAFVLILGTPKR